MWNNIWTEMKGSVSASEFIETMLSYFERNGVDPERQSTGSSRHWNWGIKRIIKIIRAIEKDTRSTKLLPAPEAHSDELLDRADKQVTQLKAEVEPEASRCSDVEDRRKLGQVVRLLENAFDQRELQEAEKTDYFVLFRSIWKCCYIR